MKISLNKQQWFIGLLINTQFIVVIHTWLIGRGFEVLDWYEEGLKYLALQPDQIHLFPLLLHLFCRYVCFGGLIHVFKHRLQCFTKMDVKLPIMHWFDHSIFAMFLTLPIITSARNSYITLCHLSKNSLKIYI